MTFKNLNITLTLEQEKFIQDQLKSGGYYCESEVIREALELLEQRDKINQMRLEKLRFEVAIGLKQLENNEKSDGEEVFQEIFEEIERDSELQ